MSKDIRKDDELLITDALKRRLIAEGQMEGGPGHFWCVVRRSNAITVPFKSSPLIPRPAPDQVMFASDMVESLNRHLHHDGAWVVVFTHPAAVVPNMLDLQETTSMARPVIDFTGYDRWAFLWLDRDGDVQFALENDDLFAETLLSGPDHWMEQAEQAWQRWHFHMREVLDKKALEGATFKRAQGERAPSVKH